MRLRRGPDKAHVIGQAGVLALRPGVDPSLFRRWLAQARALAAEWAELRGVHRHQLAGTLVRPPLQVGAVLRTYGLILTLSVHTCHDLAANGWLATAVPLWI